MNILPGIKIKGKALWLPHQRVLAIADLHLGYEEALAAEGVLVPRSQFAEIKEEVCELLEDVKPRRVVINGDFKHQFGGISKQEWREAVELMDLFIESCEKVILIRGNHDTILKPIAKVKKLKVQDSYSVGDVCFLHGGKLNQEIKKSLRDKRVKTIIIGHEHPAISIREGQRVETYKCFLKGSWHDKNLIVMPSFFTVTEGHDILKEKPLGPFLQKNLNEFEVYVLGDKVYKFGKLKRI